MRGQGRKKNWKLREMGKEHDVKGNDNSWIMPHVWICVAKVVMRP